MCPWNPCPPSEQSITPRLTLPLAFWARRGEGHCKAPPHPGAFPLLVCKQASLCSEAKVLSGQTSRSRGHDCSPGNCSWAGAKLTSLSQFEEQNTARGVLSCCAAFFLPHAGAPVSKAGGKLFIIWAMLSLLLKCYQTSE